VVQLVSKVNAAKVTLAGEIVLKYCRTISGTCVVEAFGRLSCCSKAWSLAGLAGLAVLA
jgi:hypothetical protein